MLQPATSTLFPYTTLFRSSRPRQPQLLQNVPRAQRRFRTLLDELVRSEEHTSELQSPYDLVCRPLLENKNFDHACGNAESLSLYMSTLGFIHRSNLTGPHC